MENNKRRWTKDKIQRVKDYKLGKKKKKIFTTHTKVKKKKKGNFNEKEEKKNKTRKKKKKTQTNNTVFLMITCCSFMNFGERRTKEKAIAYTGNEEKERKQKGK